MLPNILTNDVFAAIRNTNGYSVSINLLEIDTSLQLIWTSMLFEDEDVY